MEIAFAIDSFKDSASQYEINQEIEKRLSRF